MEVENTASTIRLWECCLFDSTDTVHLLTTKQNPSVLVKLQRDPHKQHIAHDMAREAEVYMALSGNKTVQPFIPRFFGHSTHLGVALTCIEKELDDFDDIGLENLSETVKQSAICSVLALSSVGVLHNDIALRNFVVSKEDPTRAKIIDFGRASISNDSKRLAEQVEHVKALLGVEGAE
jgi:predicted Ser/Thr protein kinase